MGWLPRPLRHGPIEDMGGSLGALSSGQFFGQAGRGRLTPEVRQVDAPVQQLRSRRPQETRPFSRPEPNTGKCRPGACLYGNRASVRAGDEQRGAVPDDVHTGVGQDPVVSAVPWS